MGAKAMGQTVTKGIGRCFSGCLPLPRRQPESQGQGLLCYDAALCKQFGVKVR
jgi:hypothetical protein